MKRLFLLLLLNPIFLQADIITLNFVKNKDGQVILLVNGHTDNIIVKINDQTLTLYKQDERLNLSDLGIERLVNDLDTNSGTEKKDNVVPSVNSIAAPSFATPF